MTAPDRTENDMSENKHTPGPWLPQGGRCRIEASIWTADGRCVAQMVRSEDAPLIAAAPDLLAALRKMRDWLALQSPDRDRGAQPMHSLACRTIAKAEGR